MMQNFQAVDLFSPSVSEIILNIGLSLLCSFFITIIYRLTYRGPGYSDGFVNSLIFLSAITALVLMVIGNNLARAFGLVGALSIIRFRTAIKDTIDIVYIFLSLAIGMAAGVGYHKLAIVGSLIIGAILYLFSHSNFSIMKGTQYLLQFEYLDSENKGIYKSIIDKYCKHSEVVDIRAVNGGQLLGYTFYVQMKRKVAPNSLIEELNSSPGIQKISLYFDQQNR
jgi:uncharacterized membrane protein YhiD involved in acid resistance